MKHNANYEKTELEKCKEIKDDKLRLQCFNDLAKKSSENTRPKIPQFSNNLMIGMEETYIYEEKYKLPKPLTFITNVISINTTDSFEHIVFKEEYLNKKLKEDYKNWKEVQKLVITKTEASLTPLTDETFKETLREIWETFYNDVYDEYSKTKEDINFDIFHDNTIITTIISNKFKKINKYYNNEYYNNEYYYNISFKTKQSMLNNFYYYKTGNNKKNNYERYIEKIKQTADAIHNSIRLTQTTPAKPSLASTQTSVNSKLNAKSIEFVPQSSAKPLPSAPTPSKQPAPSPTVISKPTSVTSLIVENIKNAKLLIIATNFIIENNNFSDGTYSDVIKDFLKKMSSYDNYFDVNPDDTPKYGISIDKRNDKSKYNSTLNIDGIFPQYFDEKNVEKKFNCIIVGVYNVFYTSDTIKINHYNYIMTAFDKYLNEDGIIVFAPSSNMRDVRLVIEENKEDIMKKYTIINMNFNTDVDAFNIIILKKTTLNKDEHTIYEDNIYEKLNEILNIYDNKVIFN